MNDHTAQVYKILEAYGYVEVPKDDAVGGIAVLAEPGTFAILHSDDEYVAFGVRFKNGQLYMLGLRGKFIDERAISAIVRRDVIAQRRKERQITPEHGDLFPRRAEAEAADGP